MYGNIPGCDVTKDIFPDIRIYVSIVILWMNGELMEWILFVLALLIVLVAAVVIHDITNFHIVHYWVDEKFHPLGRCVLLSDLHDHSFGHDNERLIRKIEELNPDYIFIAGDLFNATHHSKNQNAIQLLRSLSAMKNVNFEGRIFLSKGNHELKGIKYSKSYHGIMQGLKEAESLYGVHILDDSTITEREINIAGLSLSTSYYDRKNPKKFSVTDMKERLGAMDESRPLLLLAHTPEHAFVYEEYGADLVLSGHYHGGIARLPFVGGVISPRLRLFPKMEGGLKKHGETTYIISRGLSFHTIPIRFLNPGELVVFESENR